jgi:hypothetical protein
MIKGVVNKSSDFMKESENVSDEGTSRNREDTERHFPFRRRILPRAVRRMTYDNARLEEYCCAPLFGFLLRHALCRDRLPMPVIDMSSGSLKLMPFDPAPSCSSEDRLFPLTGAGKEIRLNARKFRA